VFVLERARRRVEGRIESTRDAVLRLKRTGRTQAEIARELGLTKSTVAYHFRNIGVAADERFARRYDWRAIQRAYDSGLSVRECSERFGFTLATWYQARQRGEVVARERAMPIEELLVDDRPITNRSHLKLRLLAAGLKQNVCERCGLKDWLGGPLNMQLHHRNGRGKDNRLENIEFLCPNCHAQTGNWGGRNVGRVPPA
jgi:5-methylcytosine-specific restriction endonuclease McrA